MVQRTLQALRGVGRGALRSVALVSLVCAVTLTALFWPVEASADAAIPWCEVQAGPEPTCCLCGNFDENHRPRDCYDGAFVGYTDCYAGWGGCTDQCVFGG